jgi:hypothetical protein
MGSGRHVASRRIRSAVQTEISRVNRDLELEFLPGLDREARPGLVVLPDFASRQFDRQRAADEAVERLGEEVGTRGWEGALY